MEPTNSTPLQSKAFTIFSPEKWGESEQTEIKKTLELYSSTNPLNFVYRLFDAIASYFSNKTLWNKSTCLLEKHILTKIGTEKEIQGGYYPHSGKVAHAISTFCLKNILTKQDPSKYFSDLLTNDDGTLTKEAEQANASAIKIYCKKLLLDVDQRLKIYSETLAGKINPTDAILIKNYRKIFKKIEKKEVFTTEDILNLKSIYKNLGDFKNLTKQVSALVDLTEKMNLPEVRTDVFNELKTYLNNLLESDLKNIDKVGYQKRLNSEPDDFAYLTRMQREAQTAKEKTEKLTLDDLKKYALLVQRADAFENRIYIYTSPDNQNVDVETVIKNLALTEQSPRYSLLRNNPMSLEEFKKLLCQINDTKITVDDQGLTLNQTPNEFARRSIWVIPLHDCRLRLEDVIKRYVS